MTPVQAGRPDPGNVSPAGGWERWLGSCKGVEGGQPHGKVARRTQDPSLHTDPALPLRGEESGSVRALAWTEVDMKSNVSAGAVDGHVLHEHLPPGSVCRKGLEAAVPQEH